MELPVLSASQVNAYLACPLKYRFQYVDKIPRPWRAAALGFGTAVHAAVEHFQRERMCGRTPSIESVLTAFRATWEEENYGGLVFSERESQTGLCERGEAMLRVYADEAALTPPPAAIEQPFEVTLHDPETGEVLEVAFRGVIDLIEQDGTLVDLKTAARALEAGGLERHLQLSCYALARVITTGEIPALRLDVLYKAAKPRLERLPTIRTRQELAWTAQLIREVALAIETEHFFPNPSWRCQECEYFAHCQRWRGYTPPLVHLHQAAAGGVGAVAT